MKGHWKKQFNYEYLGSYSLDGKKEIVVTVSKLAQEKVTGQQGRKEDCFVVYFKEFDKVTLYVEKGVKAFGDVVDALRIRDKKPTRQTMTKDIETSMLDAIKNGKASQVEQALIKYDMTSKQKENINLELSKI